MFTWVTYPPAGHPTDTGNKTDHNLGSVGALLIQSWILFSLYIVRIMTQYLYVSCGRLWDVSGLCFEPVCPCIALSSFFLIVNQVCFMWIPLLIFMDRKKNHVTEFCLQMMLLCTWPPACAGVGCIFYLCSWLLCSWNKILYLRSKVLDCFISPLKASSKNHQWSWVLGRDQKKDNVVRSNRVKSFGSALGLQEVRTQKYSLLHQGTNLVQIFPCGNVQEEKGILRQLWQTLIHRWIK